MKRSKPTEELHRRFYTPSGHNMLARFAASPHIAWTVLFILIPLMFVAYYSFTDGNMSFTLENISKFFVPDNLKVLLRSVKLAFIASLICLLIGYPAAYFISKMSPKTQRLMIILVMLPMWMNFIIRTNAWMTLMENKGVINSILGNIGLGPYTMIGTEGAVVIGMVYDFLPYMILPICSVMSKLDTRLIEAASDLGCNRFGVWRRVVLPLSLPGVISGCTMVFIPAISTFYISKTLGGSKLLLIGDVIEQQYNNANDLNMAAAISFVLMIIILISMAIINKFGDPDSDGGIMP